MRNVFVDKVMERMVFAGYIDTVVMYMQA